MTYPTNMKINGIDYDIPSEAEWNKIVPQIENFVRTGRQLIAINYPGGTRHALLTDGASMDIWEPNE